MLSLLVAGCGSGGGDNYGYGFGYDAQVNGLRVRYSDGGMNEPSADIVAMWFEQTLQCANSMETPELSSIQVPPPLVIVVPPDTVDPYDGLTYYDTGTVLIERQWALDRGLYVHEFVHWLLFIRHGSFHDNHNHLAPEFSCRWN